MSRAFTKEQDGDASPADIGERPVSQHRNLVTPEGLAMIDAQVAELRAQLAIAEGEGDRERIGLVSRDLRYWNARRETAELSVPDKDSKVVRFGMNVEIVNDDDVVHRWKIVGEDEADVSAGKISHVSPVAQALFGRGVGEVITVNDKDWEIAAIGTEG
ncbi:GreA/GreB family elongation factor [Aquamicrobium sp. LC103]|uniref:GreA/GreB family elongation factor n=1 Tax=Aquamicrobium sp. LC103 TaxID=1120658 RepID=UPI00063E6FBC|nr:GreA/GreB family elongation factor [Aquamicrobium sp. LC103]TKT81200.1 transcription elongation factor [Aquamicrobium sp. LC103]